ncbi:alanine:cation symporter family protein [Spongiibacter sp. KMU-158]|uniref:Alanine:cation symporter family protein n=1 Tax=Spongiibacter pelagi TaxID=2760804 RepID=A0A927C129_9GAMM|nr:alanine/glycine:cation symporter family protein [Spongiibacter pelagi]MBD2857937.1 alanine:cation symporter family protein [Spongiibacter pelagi]
MDLLKRRALRNKKRLIFLSTLLASNYSLASLDDTINAFVTPAADALSAVVFYKIPVMGADLPLVVLWLICAAIFFTGYFNFLNIRGLPQALKIVRGDYSCKEHKGEVSHFQALATAVSGTVGIGNIGGVAIAISIGGPGAAFWMILAGFFGMSTKFLECTLGTMYRRENPDGSVSGGPMYYLERAFKDRGLSRIGKFLGSFYALGIVIGCLGIGNMFQSNQAYTQVVNVTGGAEQSWLADKGWLFGIFLAISVALVIIGGIKSIARVTSKIVPFMAVFYCTGALVMILMNYDALPFAFSTILSNAFTGSGMAGGILGVMIIGFQRAVFSNEAGIGSAPIAHSAVRTDNAITEGYVALLEPFIDTIIICTLTSLVIITTQYYEPNFSQGLGGIEITSYAFERNISWSPAFIAIAGFLFAYSTMIAWGYYGLKGWTYLFGEGQKKELIFKLVFCFFVALGCSIQLEAVLSFSDALVFLICIPNIIGLYMLAPKVKAELKRFQQNMASREATDAYPIGDVK